MSKIGTKKDLIPILEKAKDDDFYELKKKNEKSLRSYAQIRYFFGVVIKEISNFHGYTPIETYELVKQMVNMDSFKELDTGEFKFLIDMIRGLWMTEYNLYIPLPNETDDLKSLGQYLF